MGMLVEGTWNEAWYDTKSSRGHFKCNRNRIADFPALSGYLRELYQVPGVAGTVRFDPIKTHYYASHRTINPTGIVPSGPTLDLRAAHGRAGDALRRPPALPLESSHQPEQAGHASVTCWPVAARSATSASVAATRPLPSASQMQTSQTSDPTAARRMNSASVAVITPSIGPPSPPPAMIAMGSPHKLAGAIVVVVTIIDVVVTVDVVLELDVVGPPTSW